jgi:hypothetical protein
MACDITSGYTLGCRDNSGGIKNIYILSGSIDSISEVSDGLIGGITGSGVFYKFELTKNTGDLTETPTPSLENGTVFYETALNVAFHKLQSSTRNQVKVLAQNPDLKIIVETNNGIESPYTGRYFLMGRYRGATLSAGSATTGTAFGDANQYALTFQGLEPEPMDEIQTSDGSIDFLSGITEG